MGENWRDRTATTFTCEKKPAHGSRGMLSGAACWRADGTPVAISGGPAHAGVRFGLR